MTLGKKLFCGFMLLLVFLFITGLVGYFNTVTLIEQFSKATEAQEDALFITEKEVDHLNWVSTIAQGLLDKKEFHVEQDPHKCSFGTTRY